VEKVPRNMSDQKKGLKRRMARGGGHSNTTKPYALVPSSSWRHGRASGQEPAPQGEPRVEKRGTRSEASGSHELGPVVVRHDARTSPFLAIGVGARACEEAVLGMLED
jgi:hypothetical protein